MRYVSLFSGIEAASVAMQGLGWEPVAFCEIEPFPSAVLKYRFPHVPNLGDVTKVDWKEFRRANGPVDLVVFGSPCQSFSVAGKRLGLDDPRGNLALAGLKVAYELGARWFVFENVPGLLSSADGRDFGLFLRAVEECGYSCAWRVLDAQYVRTPRFPRAVPQRRRRVFVVGHLGDWRRAAAVLFEPEGLQGHPPPRREAGQGSARGAAAGVAIRGREGGGTAELTGDVATAIRASQGGGDKPHVLASTGDVAHCLNAGGMGRIDYETETMVAHALRGDGFDASEDGTGRGTPLVPVAFAHQAGGKQTTLGATGDGTCQTLGAHQTPAVAFDLRGREGGAMPEGPHETANLRASSGGSSRSYVAQPWAVRRLTPLECERLQGFPEGWTQIPYRNKPADQCPDGPRYKALGNSWAVNCGEFIFDRMRIVDAMPEASLEAAE